MPLIIFEIKISNLKSLSKVACLSGCSIASYLTPSPTASQDIDVDLSQPIWTGVSCDSNCFRSYIYRFYLCVFKHSTTSDHVSGAIKRKPFHACCFFFFIIVFHKSKGSTNLNILLHFPPSEWELSSFSCRTNTGLRGDLKNCCVVVHIMARSVIVVKLKSKKTAVCWENPDVPFSSVRNTHLL